MALTPNGSKQINMRRFPNRLVSCADALATACAYKYLSRTDREVVRNILNGVYNDALQKEHHVE